MLDRFLGIICLLMPLAVTRYFNDYFTVIKWHTVHIAAFISVFLLPYKFKVPRLGKYWPLLYLAAAASVYSIFIKNPQDWHIPFLDRVSFVALFVAFYNAKDWKWIKLGTIVSTTLVIAYYLGQLLGHDKFNLALGSAASSTFGNANILAQFLGFSTTIISSWGLPGLLVGALSLACVFELGCRSILLAVIVSTPFILGKKAIDFFIYTLFFCFFIALIPGSSDVITKTAVEVAQGQHTGDIRSALWADSLKLYKDNPLGIGVGNFEFSLSPYQIGSKLPNDETVVYSTPHNEFLRYLTEDGPIYLIPLLLLILWGWKRNKSSHLSGTLIFLFIESLFQFPFMNAAGFFYAAAILSRNFTKDQVTAKWTRFLKVHFIPVIFVIWINISSTHKTAVPKTVNDLRSACEMLPGNWRACLLAASAEMNSGRYFEAQRLLFGVVQRNPHNYGAIKLLMANEFRMNLHYGGCFWGRRYDSYFGDSSISKDRKEVCAKWDEHYNGLYGGKI